MLTKIQKSLKIQFFVLVFVCFILPSIVASQITSLSYNQVGQSSSLSNILANEPACSDTMGCIKVVNPNSGSIRILVTVTGNTFPALDAENALWWSSTTITAPNSDGNAQSSINYRYIGSGSVLIENQNPPTSRFTFTIWKRPATSTTYIFVRRIIFIPSTFFPGLSSLTINSGDISPVFSASVYTYSVSVLSSVSSIRITAEKAGDVGQVVVNGVVVDQNNQADVSLEAPGRATTVVVTNSASSTLAAYTIVVSRGREIRLANLNVEGVSLTPSFSPGTFTYSAFVSGSMSLIKMTPSFTFGTASASVNGGTAVSLTSDAAIDLNLGNPGSQSTVAITTSLDGVSTTYTVIVSRGNTIPLSSLILRIGAEGSNLLSPEFSPTTYTYAASVASGVSSVVIVPSSAVGQVKVASETVDSGSSFTFPLQDAGSITSIPVSVTLNDQTTIYTVVVARTSLSTTGSSSGCFSDNQFVSTQQGSRAINLLQPGDLVFDGTDFSAVTWVMKHIEPKQILSINLKDNDGFSYTIDVTPNHYMIVLERGHIEAKDVVVGDLMKVVKNGALLQGTVVSIRQLPDKGPVRLVLTKSGSIVVNSVVASTTEASGSKIVESLLHVASSIGGERGLQVIRDVSYAVGSWITNGDAVVQGVESPPLPTSA